MANLLPDKCVLQDKQFLVLKSDPVKTNIGSLEYQRVVLVRDASPKRFVLGHQGDSGR